MTTTKLRKIYMRVGSIFTSL